MDLNDKFTAIIEFKMALVDVKRAWQNLRLLFPEDLEGTVVSKLIHLKSIWQHVMRQPNQRILIGYVSGLEKNYHIYPNVDFALKDVH